LLANQDRLSNAYYEEIAKQLGMNLAQFNRDRKSESSSLAIAKDIQLGDKLGIKGTPFFVINGQGFYGVITDKDLEKIISSPKPMPKNNLGLKPSS
jgi:protein-disulfide isomerase